MSEIKSKDNTIRIKSQRLKSRFQIIAKFCTKGGHNQKGFDTDWVRRIAVPLRRTKTFGDVTHAEHHPTDVPSRRNVVGHKHLCLDSGNRFEAPGRVTPYSFLPIYSYHLHPCWTRNESLLYHTLDRCPLPFDDPLLSAQWCHSQPFVSYDTLRSTLQIPF